MFCNNNVANCNIKQKKGDTTSTILLIHTSKSLHIYYTTSNDVHLIALNFDGKSLKMKLIVHLDILNIKRGGIKLTKYKIQKNMHEK